MYLIKEKHQKNNMELIKEENVNRKKFHHSKRLRIKEFLRKYFVQAKGRKEGRNGKGWVEAWKILPVGSGQKLL